MTRLTTSPTGAPPHTTLFPENVHTKLRDSRARAIIWICALQVLDLATTYTAIRWAGAEEANPIARLLLDSYAIVAAKAVVCLLIIYVARRTPPTVRATAASWFVAGLYAMAVVSNFIHLIMAAVAAAS